MKPDSIFKRKKCITLLIDFVYYARKLWTFTCSNKQNIFPKSFPKTSKSKTINVQTKYYVKTDASTCQSYIEKIFTFIIINWFSTPVTVN